jgi:hypothetical protein
MTPLHRAISRAGLTGISPPGTTRIFVSVGRRFGRPAHRPAYGHHGNGGVVALGGGGASVVPVVRGLSGAEWGSGGVVFIRPAPTRSVPTRSVPIMISFHSTSRRRGVFACLPSMSG